MKQIISKLENNPSAMPSLWPAKTGVMIDDHPPPDPPHRASSRVSTHEGPDQTTQIEQQQQQKQQQQKQQQQKQQSRTARAQSAERGWFDIPSQMLRSISSLGRPEQKKKGTDADDVSEGNRNSDSCRDVGFVHINKAGGTSVITALQTH